METVGTIAGIFTGFFLSKILSFPQGSHTSTVPFINKSLPKLQIKSLQFFPRFRIYLKKRVIHIHHWMILSALFIALITITASFTQLLFLKSLCVGGIIQGFTYKDRFQIILKSNLS